MSAQTELLYFFPVPPTGWQSESWNPAVLHLAQLIFFDRLFEMIEIHKLPLFYNLVIAVAYFQQ